MKDFSEINAVEEAGGGAVGVRSDGATRAGMPVDDPEARFSSRSIRSFVLRQGRMSAAQHRYLEQEMPRIGIPYRIAPIDLNQAFGRDAPKIVEIGFGMGETTAKIAAARPEHDFLGIEVHGPGVGNLCKLVAEQGLNNLRIMQHDAVEVLRDMIGEGTLAGVHVFFPDPWHKKRHHKRRIIQPDFVALVASRLAPGGYLHCATDWEEYAAWMLEILRAEPLLKNSVAETDRRSLESPHEEAGKPVGDGIAGGGAGYAPRPDYRPLTKFENRGLRLGHGVWDLVFVRRAG